MAAAPTYLVVLPEVEDLLVVQLHLILQVTELMVRHLIAEAAVGRGSLLGL